MSSNEQFKRSQVVKERNRLITLLDWLKKERVLDIATGGNGKRLKTRADQVADDIEILNDALISKPARKA